jgi:hypothetical protein
VTTRLETLEAEILKLPVVDRARLTKLLIESLDADPQGQQAWEQVSGTKSVAAGSEATARLRAIISR